MHSLIKMNRPGTDPPAVHVSMRRTRMLPRIDPSWLLFCSVAVLHPAVGASQEIALSQFQMRVWDEADGFPSGFINSVVRTPDGYLWVGTSGGLARFDGMQVTVFDASSQSGLRVAEVGALAVDSGGVLWIGTGGGGVVSHSAGKFTVASSVQPIRAELVDALEAVDGTLWIGTASGLYRLRGDVLEHHDADNRRIFDIAAAPDGLVAGTARGIFAMRRGRGAPVAGGEVVEQAEVRAVLVDREGVLWVGTRTGLFHQRDGRLIRFELPETAPSDFIHALYEDAEGSLWIGTAEGLFRWDRRRVQSLTAAEGLPSGDIRSIHGDEEGSLWLGTTGGLVQLRRPLFLPVTPSEGLSAEIVLPILQARDGSMWIGTFGGGVNVLDRGSIRHVSSASGLSSDYVLSLVEGADGSVWIGTRAGLNRWRDGVIRKFTTTEGLAHNTVSGLMRDDRGRIWAGTSGGLSVFEDGGFRTIESTVGVSFTVLLQARDGAVWAGTHGRGALRLHGSDTTWIDAHRGLPSNSVNVLHETPPGVLWIGTTGGLARFDGSRLVKVGYGHGLPWEDMNWILQDDAGDFWLSGTRGVFRVDGAALDSVALGLAPRVTGISYTAADGMPSTETNGAIQPGGWKDDAGHLWFPTMAGATVVDPDEASRRIAARIPLRIEQILVNDRSVAIPGSEIGPGVDYLRIDYVAMTLVDAGRLEFRHRLAGFDRGWSSPTTSRSAFYTTLPPGDYRFQLQVRRPNGLWQGMPSQDLVVRSHFYETWWFRLLAATALIALLYFVHFAGVRAFRTRERQLLDLIEERERAESRFRDLFESAHDIIFTTDFERRILSMNRAGRELLGYDPAGEELGAIVDVGSRPLLEQWPTPRRPKTRTIDLRLVGKDGELYDVEIATQVVTAEAAAPGVQAIARDVTDRLALEAQLRQAQKMEAVGQLSGGIAHDFNNLLTTMKGNLQLALEALPEQHTVREDLAEVDHAVDSATALTRQLLAFSRKQVVQMEPVALNDVINGTRGLLRRLLTESIELRTALQPDLGIVRADRGQLEQLILNLAVNARDAMPDGGVLTIRTRNVASAPGEQQRFVLLEIEDTGVGMDASLLPKIFDPFFTTKEIGRGTGLGLSTVQAIVQQLDGRVDVESRPGAGSCFRIRLPVVHEMPHRTITPEPGKPPRGTESILIVEDEAPVRTVVRRTLERLGYKVREAADPLAALDILQHGTEPVDLLLSDLIMPHMGGIELARLARQQHPRLRVLYMSGYSGDQTPGIDLEHEDAALIGKPFTSEQLAAAVRQALDRSDRGDRLASVG